MIVYKIRPDLSIVYSNFKNNDFGQIKKLIIKSYEYNHLIFLTDLNSKVNANTLNYMDTATKIIIDYVFFTTFLRHNYTTS